ncbi:serine hydrolase domain-containing protein [Streptomyces sp. KR55]|uniref:serine hydrolase domain-containing protein n=1 Tax=Streptomyces sp. KR55 TaxID=3457425 RepID=UPI003FD5309C
MARTAEEKGCGGEHAEGRLRLDDSLERHLPGLVPDGAKITVRHLLSHRSGLFNYTDSLWPGGLQEIHDTRFKRFTPPELIAESNRHKPGFAPSTAGSYSNTNYVLLGMLIEKATGTPARQEIMRRIVKPLHLRGTSFPDLGVDRRCADLDDARPEYLLQGAHRREVAAGVPDEGDEAGAKTR